MSAKRWSIGFLAIISTILICVGILTIVIDPYFHYHAPLTLFQYPMEGEDERYINNGIIKHFDYNAIITGTSMVENFKTSEFDNLFNVKSVKIPFSGGTYKEIDSGLREATSINDNIKIIIRCLDYSKFFDEKDKLAYDISEYPSFLYDDNIYNDVQYLYNKSILLNNTLKVIVADKTGKRYSFDSYGNWMANYSFGKEAVDKSYVRKEKSSKIIQMTDKDYINMQGNILQNVIEVISQNPHINFYLFFPPYSIYYWDNLNQEGCLNMYFQAEKYIIEMLLEYENIHLFSFLDDYELVCNLDNYKDIAHYHENINSKILLCMWGGSMK